MTSGASACAEVPQPEQDDMLNTLSKFHTGLLRSTALLALVAAGATHADTTRVVLGYVGDTHSSAYLGVRQGLDEANLQGKFLGLEFDLKAVDAGTLDAKSVSGYPALLVAGDAAMVKRVAALAPDRAVFNLAAGDDSLRAECLDNLLSVIPSARMKQDAVNQWHKLHPGADVAARAWDNHFMKYAGRDLNKRFTRAFKRPMDDLAWAGWAAARMIGDVVARTGGAQAGDLLKNLKEQESFDGQKGIEMTFRANGQLRQPLLLVEGDRLVGEAPVRGVVDPEDLDSLGAGGCGK